MKKGINSFQIILTMSDVLRQFTGDPGLPAPDKILRQCWNSDPYSMGSGSYPSVTTTDDDFEHLLRPLPSDADPRLFFAGEATHSQYWGQVSLNILTLALNYGKILMHYFRR